MLKNKYDIACEQFPPEKNGKYSANQQARIPHFDKAGTPSSH
jgi:hypothetical protein